MDQSPTVRSDTYIDWKYLAPLSREFCEDLVKDHTEVLQWLDHAETHRLVSDNTVFFNIDVKSLYDSLEDDLVKDAVVYAIRQCRPDRNEDLIQWILDLKALNNRN